MISRWLDHIEAAVIGLLLALPAIDAIGRWLI